MVDRLRKRLSYLICFATGLAFISCIATSSFAASDKQSEEQYTARVIDELNKKSSMITTYSMETLKVEYAKGSFTIQTGKKWVASDNRWRWEGSTHTGELTSDFLIVSDGSTVWSKDDLTQAILKRPTDLKSPAEPFNLRLINNKQGNGNLHILGKTELRPGQAVYEIECQMPEISISKKPDENKSGTHLVKAWIGVADGLLYKVTEYDKVGSEVATSIFRNYELNIPIDPERFHFEVPANTTVIDLIQTSKEKGLITLPVQVKGRKPDRDS